MTNDEQRFLEAVKAQWGEYLVHPKLLGDWGVVGLQKFMFTWAILAEVTPFGYGDRWCYHGYGDAKAAFDAWDGKSEPKGWHRHPASGRRIKEDGTMEVYR
jgi:hypothetical protein